MTKHVDFDNIGKKTPYRIPEGFFEEMQQQVLHQVEEKPHRRLLSIKHLSYAAIGVAAAAAAFIFVPRDNAEIDQEYNTISWIEQLSDEDLKTMDDISDYDIFMD